MRQPAQRAGTDLPVRLLLSSTLGPRTERPWCQPPALCPDCFHERGGTAGVHARCAEEAAKAQEHQDADQSRLDAGDLALFSITTTDVPTGVVRLTFYPSGAAPDGPVRIVVPVEVYDPAKRWLSDYPDRVRVS